MRKLFLTLLFCGTLAVTSQAIPYVIGVNDWTEGAEPQGAEIYKANVDGNFPSQDEEGSAKDLFETFFGIDPSDPKDFAQLFWDPQNITPKLTAVYLKVGGQGGHGAWVHTAISGVDLAAYDSILVWKPAGDTAMSHLRITSDTSDRVPDGGSMSGLLGAVVGGLAFLRWKTRV